MRRSWLAIFTGLILTTVSLQAQRMSGGGHGGSHGGVAHAAVSNRGAAIGITGGEGFARGRGFNRRRGFGYGYGYWPGYYWDAGLGWDLPYWDYVDFPPTDVPPDSYYPPDGQASRYSNNPSSRPVIVTRDRGPATPVESPKLIEIPLPNDKSVARTQPPALFVLNDGEKLESRRYVLSADSLQIDIGRKQRTIPISALNVDATIAANQERGIDVSVPQDRNSLFLGF
jgi:hypothetical protein